LRRGYAQQCLVAFNAVVAIAQSRPEVLDVARRHEKIFDEVTLDDVNLAVNVFKPTTSRRWS
jgi:sulfate adenylyltransferase subunit 1 (EFTu-like GTPase family)